MSRPSEKETLTVDAALPASGGQTVASTRVFFEHLPAGTLLGRYTILALVGAGGMGVVYAAYDPKLDRRIALKLVRSNGDAGADASARLLREAQALARLSHPNVVAIYDASIVGDAVCIEMEYVDGVTLDAWADGKSPRELLAAYEQAGRALAAAHAAGLVHRDFKPSNAVVDKTGRVRVLDFGLARGATEEPVGANLGSSTLPPPSEPEDAELVRVSASTPSVVPPTELGTTMGTPAFMPPEQWQGRVVDARADQYAFAASLFEALYGALPFPQASRKTMRSIEARGPLAPRPAGSAVPAYVHRALVRALAFAPLDRFASMEELLAALARDPAVTTRRRVAALVAVVAAVTVTASGVKIQRARDAAVCGSLASRLDGVWDDAKMRAVHESLAREGRPGAEDAWVRTKASLDAYAASWLASRTQSCEETRQMAAPLADSTVGLRLVCLDWRLRDLRALTDVLASDPGLVHESAHAASSLPPIAECAQASLLSAVKPPEDPRLRARVEDVRARLAEAESLRLASRPRAARPVATRALEEARAAKAPAAEAAALLVLGRIEDDDGKYAAAATSLEQAVWVAEASRDDVTLAEATTALAWVVGSRLADRASGARWERHALAAVERVGAPDSLAAELDFVRSVLARQRQELAEAVVLSERFLERATRARGPMHPRVASAEHNLANSYMALARNDEAIAHFRKSREILEVALGAGHPRIAAALGSEAIVCRRKGDLPAALELYQRALAIREAALGPDHPEVALTTSNMGVALFAAGRLDEAYAAFTRALEIRRKTLGEDHPSIASSLTSIAAVERKRKRYPEARAHLERAVQIHKKVGGKESAAQSSALIELAELALDEKRPKDALAQAEHALALRTKTLGAAHPDVASALVVIGKCHLAQRDATRALPLLERAVEILADRSPRSLADAKFVLARALRDLQSDAPRARALASAAEATFAKDEEATKDDLDEVRAWLAANARWLSAP